MNIKSGQRIWRRLLRLDPHFPYSEIEYKSDEW